VDGARFHATFENFHCARPGCAKPQNEPLRLTWKGIGALLNSFSPQECANYLVNAG
jgi:hypothetical protein